MGEACRSLSDPSQTLVRQVGGAQVQEMGCSVQRQLPEQLLMNRAPSSNWKKRTKYRQREKVRKNYCSWLFRTFPDFGTVKTLPSPMLLQKVTTMKWLGCGQVVSRQAFADH